MKRAASGVLLIGLLVAGGCRSEGEEGSTSPPEAAAPPTEDEADETADHPAGQDHHAGHEHHASPAPIDDDPAMIRTHTAASTLAMAERLRAVAAGTDPRDNQYDSAGRVEMFRQEARGSGDPNVYFQLALELLRSGEVEEAITGFGAILERFQTRYPEAVEQIATLAEMLALAYLRLGELENCIANHSIDSCLLPISGAGVHTVQRGSREAYARYLAQLEREPDSLKFQWLLNVAAMTLGEYPEGVPERWRIDPAVFDSTCDFSRFTDVAISAGVAALGMAGGSVSEDFNRDGDLDLLVSSWGMLDNTRYFRNEGDGTFTDRTVEAGLHGVLGGLNLVPADYDNDGFVDVYVLRGAWLDAAGRVPNSLLRNRGDGSFEDVTEAAGMLTARPTQTAVWADFDLDGWIDLFVGNESGGGRRHPCELFMSNGDGTFTERAAEAGADVIGYVKGVTAGDYDNDGRPDVYVSCLTGPNMLLRNAGPLGDVPVTFTDVTIEADVGLPLRSFPTWFWDYDNDGHLDLFVAGYGIQDIGDICADYLGLMSTGERLRLFRNTGDGRFEDVSAAAGISIVTIPMGANFGDLDSDGWLDFYLGTGDPTLKTILPNRMFRGNADGRFDDVTTTGGFGHLQKGHGISFADFDNDGDQDVHAVMGGAFTGDVAFNVLFQNPGNDNAWVTLRLEGTRSNRAAIGARVRIDLDTPDGPRSIHRVLTSGGSFGANSLQLDVGLGNATAIRSITIRWPSNSPEQTIEGVALRSVVEIVEPGG